MCLIACELDEDGRILLPCRLEEGAHVPTGGRFVYGTESSRGVLGASDLLGVRPDDSARGETKVVTSFADLEVLCW